MKNLIILCWLPFCLSLFSQEGYLYIEHLHRGQGLPAEHINALLGSDDGYLWLATRQGLYRYDGYDFQAVRLRQDSVALPHYSVTQIEDAGQGNFFLALGSHGFGIYDPAIEQFRLYQSEEGNQQGLPSGQVDFILDDGDHAWLLLEANGLCRFDKCTGVFRHYLPSKLLDSPPARANELVSLAHDPLHPGRLWISSVYGLLSFDKEKAEMQLYPRYGKEGDAFTIMGILVDEQGLLYATTWHEGVLCFDTRTKQWLGPVPGNEEAGLTSVHFIRQKQKGQIWIGDVYKGLFLYDAGRKALELAIPHHSVPGPVRSENYLLAGTVMDMAKDALGAWWIVEQTKGLAAIFPKKQLFTRYHLPAGSQCLARQKGTPFLFSTTNSRAVYRVDGSSGQIDTIPVKYRRRDQFLFRSCWCDEQGRFFMLGNEALYQYHPGKNIMEPVDIPELERVLLDENIWASSILRDSRGQLWVGTNREVLRFNSALQLQDSYSFADTVNGAVMRWNGFAGLLEAPGHRIWFISDRGFGFTDDNGQRFTLYRHTSARSQAVGLTGLLGLALDGQGRIWVGSKDKGLGFVYDTLPHPQEIQVLTVEDGLVNDQVRSMASGPGGSLWLLTVGGLIHIPAAGIQPRNFGTGYQQELTNCYDITSLEDGRLALGHLSGFLLAEPEALTPDTAFLPVSIQSLSVFGQPYLKEEALLPEKNIKLSYKQNFFTIAFASPRAGSPEPVLYQYKLEGWDEEWRQAGLNRYASFTNVREGRYTFKVRSSTVPGVWSRKNIRSLSIVVTPPYWRTLWFRVLVLLLIATSISLFIRYRIRRVKREEALKSAFNKKVAELEMQALKAQMNPHFLFNSLQSIKWHLINNKPEVSVQYIDRFAFLIRKVLNNSKSSLVRLSEELEALELYIQIEQSRFPERFDYEIRVGPEIPADFVQIPPLLLQPFVENAIWHGLMHKKNGGGKLLVCVRKAGQDLEMEVEDNGVGREIARQLKANGHSRHPSMGIKLTRERLEVFEKLFGLKAEMKVADLKSDRGHALGTRVFIRLPEWLD